tara:strand:+ start:5966 stop:6145 length:180 start_codon:yes stop_codon:yes gene_type:complete
MKIVNSKKQLRSYRVDEREQPYIQIPLPPPEWEEYVRRMKEEQEQEKLDTDHGVIIIDI